MIYLSLYIYIYNIHMYIAAMRSGRTWPQNSCAELLSSQSTLWRESLIMYLYIYTYICSVCIIYIYIYGIYMVHIYIYIYIHTRMVMIISLLTISITVIITNIIA